MSCPGDPWRLLLWHHAAVLQLSIQLLPLSFLSALCNNAQTGATNCLLVPAGLALLTFHLCDSALYVVQFSLHVDLLSVIGITFLFCVT